MNLGFVKKYKAFFEVILKINNSIFNKQKISKGNTVTIKCAYLNNCKINIIGTGNIIDIDDYSRLNKCNITIYGNNCSVRIGERCYLNQLNIFMEDDENHVSIGEHTSVDGMTELACIEGTKIDIGYDCMFSRNIHIRTGDSHSITNLNGERINISKSISISNHVWIGTDTILLKGCSVGENSVVGAGSILSGKTYRSNSVIAGVPGKEIKQEITWKRERI